MAAFTPYNISLNSSSPTFIYEPFQEGWYALQGDPTGGWRTSFSSLTTWPNPGLGNFGTGVPLRETYLDGANVTLQFEGTALYLCLLLTESAYTFTVDGSPVSTTGSAEDPACASTAAHLMAYVDGLTYGSHTATLRVNSQGNADFQFFGGVVTVGLNGTNPTIERIDDAEVGWSYQPAGVWIFSTPATATNAANDYAGTRHWMCSYGPAFLASYTFNESAAVQLLGMLDLNMGPFTIQFDGQSYVYNGSDLWHEPQQVLFFKAGLDPTKEYTITLINYDPAAPNAQQPVGPDFYPCASVDELILTKVTPGLPSTGGGGNGTAGAGSGGDTTGGAVGGATGNGSSRVGAIAGGVVGGVALLCIALFLLWFFWWRKRSAPLSDSSRSEIDPYPQNEANEEAIPYPLPRSMYSAAPTSESALPGLDLHKPEDGNYIQSPLQLLASPVPVQSPTEHRDTKQHLNNMSMRQPSAPISLSIQQSSATSTSESTPYQVATTQELVGILNQRLREEYRAENDMDPELPQYAPAS